MATLAKAAQKKIATTKKKDTTPSGKYIGKESGKGLLPVGYKGPEKGKYYGPDSKKGANPTYKAPAKKAAAPKPAAAPAAPAPTAPTAPAPGQQSAYNPDGSVSNASGTISLQTTHDLNMQELEAQEAHDQAVAAATEGEQQAELLYNETSGTEVNALNEQRRSDRGKLNSGLAYRGLTSGSTATQKATEMSTAHQNASNQIAAQRKLARDNANNARTAAGTSLAERKKQITLARQSYTTEESATSPTEGSQAEESGVTPTDVTPEVAPAAPAAAAAPAAPKPAAKPTYKGKYKGPDRFKGDEKKLAAWRKAGRPKK